MMRMVGMTIVIVGDEEDDDSNTMTRVIVDDEGDDDSNVMSMVIVGGEKGVVGTWGHG